jgi:DNA processing protein
VTCPLDERSARAALLRVAEPGRGDVHAAVAARGAVAVWRALRGHGPVPGLSAACVAAARHRAAGYDPQADLDRLAALGGRLVCPGDAEWPDGLDWPAEVLTDAPPLGVHVIGPHRLAAAVARSVAVVGARAATAYGTHVAQELGASLADRRCTVVSGAAYGIDGAAHTGALNAGGAPTVAVLACGVDVAYPRGHARLLGRIAGQGLVVSELPVGSTPTRSRFLVRNRLIAALSRGTVAVEAARRSGSLATAERAEALGRHVMAVPGPVTSAASAGTNALLRRGATCVTDAGDVLDTVGVLGEDAQQDRPGEHRPLDDLPAAVRQVLEAVPVRRSAGVSTIARDAGVAPLLVQQVLPPLVLNGLVAQTPDGYRLTPLGAGRPAAARSGGAA